jgi:hypothetical protein
MAISANSLANLRPVKPGEVLNPKGRPKKENDLLTYIREKLGDVCEYDKQGRTWLEALADAELRYALTENAARMDLLNRLWGKPIESLSVNESSGGLILRVIYGDKASAELPSSTENPPVQTH